MSHIEITPRERLESKVKLTILTTRFEVEKELKATGKLSESEHIIKTLCLSGVGKQLFELWQSWSIKHNPSERVPVSTASSSSFNFKRGRR